MRILAAIGLHPAMQAALAQQLWTADHVVLAKAQRDGNTVNYGLRKVYKGDAATLRLGEGRVLRLEDGEAAPAAGGSVLLFLKGHRVLAVYEAASWRVAELEGLMRRPPFDTRGCGTVTRRGDFVLCTEILYAGTRSQGRRGRLYREGAEVRGERKGQVVDGFVYLGEERAHLWSVSGWDLQGG